MKPKIVILEAQTVNPGDLSWDSIAALGTVVIYKDTSSSELIARSQEANILITNKLKINAHVLQQLPKLKLICQLATGYDNIDLNEARTRSIDVCNAVGYSTSAVAQHAIALLLAVTNRVQDHHLFVQQGGWSKALWSHSLVQLRELSGLTLGVYGFGQIGRRVASIAQSLGMNIMVNTRDPKKYQQWNLPFVSLESLFSTCNVISLHAPLTSTTRHIVDRQLLNLLPPRSIIINTGRGDLIVEQDLRDYLLEHPDQYAALDVLSSEPPPPDHPLVGLDNCIITPHNAWAARAARARLIDIVADNIQAFMAGQPINIVN